MNKGKRIKAFNTTNNISEWARLSGICRRVISYRLQNGWDAEKAITLSATNGNNQYLRY